MESYFSVGFKHWQIQDLLNGEDGDMAVRHDLSLWVGGGGAGHWGTGQGAGT